MDYNVEDVQVSQDTELSNGGPRFENRFLTEATVHEIP